MEHKESTKGTAGVLKHPDAAEWMDFLYGELPRSHTAALQKHVEQCDLCAGQLREWRETMQSLDRFELPPRPATAKPWITGLGWAAAAALVVAAGVAIGSRFSSDRAEIARLKSSVQQLSVAVESQQASALTNSIFAATAAANEQTIRLLGEFASSQETKRAADRESVQFALQAFEARLATLHRDLETVAVNTQNGFQETRHNLSQLVTYFPPQPTNPK